MYNAEYVQLICEHSVLTATVLPVMYCNTTEVFNDQNFFILCQALSPLTHFCSAVDPVLRILQINDTVHLTSL